MDRDIRRGIYKHWIGLLASLMLAAVAIPVAAVEPATATSDEEQEDLREALAEAREKLRDAGRELMALQSELGRDGAGRGMFTFHGDRAMLGINLADRASGDRTSDGVYVAGVTPGGPAEAAGLESGDVITRIDEIELGGDAQRSPEAWLVEYLDRLEPGTEVSLTYRRDGQEHEVSVTTEALGARAFGFRFGDEGFDLRIPRLPEAARAFRFGFGAPDWADMELVMLSEELGRYFGTTEGLLVVRAPEMDVLGLRDGDVILAIDGRDPRNPNHAMRILNSYAPGEALGLEIMRDGEREEIEVTIPEDIGEPEHLRWQDGRN